jgi:hypothetical protein
MMSDAEDLQRIALSLRETFDDESIVLPQSRHNWYNEAIRFHAWYYRAVQLMTDSGFVGLEKFKSLCEGDGFSMLDFYTGLADGGQPERGWRDKLLPRLLQMHFMLGALPAAVKVETPTRAPGRASILDRLGDIGEVDRLERLRTRT